MAGDHHRPQYHFLPPANWMNDPNGLIQWKGQYHLFYQYNPYSPIHFHIHWGHAVSPDLVHWTDLPIALTPTPGGFDANGCWSGCAVNNNGVPTLLYTGVFPQVVCLATSSDDLLSWQSYPLNPVIKGPPQDIADQTGGHFRDPFVWKEEGWWYLVMGSKIEEEGGLILLYRSPDLINWEYLQPLLAGDLHQEQPVWTGTMWECPNFLTFGERRVLILSIQATSSELLYPLYFVGTYHNHQFTPQTQEIMAFGGYFYAPQVMRDEQNRYLMWGWLKEGRGQSAFVEAGWAGAMSVPIIVSLEPDGNLHLEPVPELENLRQQHQHYENVAIFPGEANFLKEVRGDCLEIIAEFEPDQSSEFEFKLCCSTAKEEQTRLIYRPGQQQIVVDRAQSSLDTTVDQEETTVPVKLAPGEALNIHIFLDRSVLELFVNNRTYLASRIYPTRRDSTGLDLVSPEKVVRLKTLDIWSVDTVWG
jgi:beta-fructofuranosidase